MKLKDMLECLVKDLRHAASIKSNKKTLFAKVYFEEFKLTAARKRKRLVLCLVGKPESFVASNDHIWFLLKAFVLYISVRFGSVC